MSSVFVIGASVYAEGLLGWDAARPVLSGQLPWKAEKSPLPPPTILPPNERRRAGLATRLALVVAQEAAAASRHPPTALRSIFASSIGDGATIDAILQTLASENQSISPTLFHNSVHNAAAGYWAIGTGSTQAAICIACHDMTVAGALMTAVAEVSVAHVPVLMCVYDASFCTPLDPLRPITGMFGAALVLSPKPVGNCLGRIMLDWREGIAPLEADEFPSGVETSTSENALDTMACVNPAARILPLLRALAGASKRRLSLAMLDGYVSIETRPYP